MKQRITVAALALVALLAAISVAWAAESYVTAFPNWFNYQTHSYLGHDSAVADLTFSTGDGYGSTIVPGSTGSNTTITLPAATCVLSSSGSALTSGRVPFATTGGVLTDSSGFLFGTSTSTLTLGKVAASNSGKLTLLGLTSGSITLAPSDAAGSGTWTLRTGTDNVVGAATADTFTNKTYDTAGSGNVFSINGTAVSAVSGTGAVCLVNTPTLITPVLGVATGTSLAVTGLLTGSSPSALVGYKAAVGTGGTGGQASSKSTTVVMSPNPCKCGTITMNNAALAAGTTGTTGVVTFTVTDSACTGNTYVNIQHESGGTVGCYTVQAVPTAGSFNVTVRNNSGGSLSEGVVLRFYMFEAPAG